MKLFKIGKDCKRRFAVVSVTDGLKVVVGVGDLYRRLFRLGVKSHITEIRRKVKSVIGAFFPAPNVHIELDLYFLLVGVLVRFVVYVPAECDKKFVDEVVPGGLFGIGRGEIIILVAFEIFDKLFYSFVRGFKSGFEHGFSLSMPKGKYLIGNIPGYLQDIFPCFYKQGSAVTFIETIYLDLFPPAIHANQVS